MTVHESKDWTLSIQDENGEYQEIGKCSKPDVQISNNTSWVDEQGVHNFITEPGIKLPELPDEERTLKPNVRCLIVDESMPVIVKPVGYPTLNWGNVKGPKMYRVIANEWQRMYEYDSKLPIVAYLAGNNAFMDKRNKLPRGAERRLAKIKSDAFQSKFVDSLRTIQKDKVSYHVVCDETNNSQEDMDERRLNVNVVWGDKTVHTRETALTKAAIAGMIKGSKEG